jgi:hypothetical protein
MQKNKLTLYIFIALVLGVIAGYIYNATVINAINTKMSAAEAQIKTIDLQIAASKDTTTADFKALKTQRTAQAKVRGLSK